MERSVVLNVTHRMPAFLVVVVLVRAVEVVEYVLVVGAVAIVLRGRPPVTASTVGVENAIGVTDAARQGRKSEIRILYLFGVFRKVRFLCRFKRFWLFCGHPYTSLFSPFHV